MFSQQKCNVYPKINIAVTFKSVDNYFISIKKSNEKIRIAIIKSKFYI